MTLATCNYKWTSPKNYNNKVNSYSMNWEKGKLQQKSSRLQNNYWLGARDVGMLNEQQK